MALIELDILHPVTFAKVGSGPITSASLWRCTERIDRAGVFALQMPASDAKAALVQEKYIVQAFARMLDGTRSEVGMGIIDKIGKTPQADGTVLLDVSGDTIVRELTYRSVRKLKLYDGGDAVSHATALAAVAAYAPDGWTFTQDGDPDNDFVYAYFNGESVLHAIVKIADKCQNHFYRGEGKSIHFASAFTPSGVRAIQARGQLPPGACAIVSLSEELDTYQLITRIYPLGSGNGGVELDLAARLIGVPSGYTIDEDEGYIQNTALYNQLGLIEEVVRFKDIGPIDPTTPDIQAATDMLVRAGLEYLKRHSVEIQATYTVKVAGCTAYLRPMQSIDVIYRNLAAGLDVDARLNLLEVTWQVDRSGFQVTDFKATNGDRWPQSEVGLIADTMAEGRVYQVLPQLNANSYVTGYSKLIDNDEVAQFRFRMGNDVTRLRAVYFEFQILPFESTIKNLIAETVTSSGGGSSLESASSGGSHSHTVTIAQHSHTVTIAAHGHTVTIAAHTHTVTVPAHSHTVTITNHVHTVTVSDHVHDIPDHQHSTTVAGGGGTEDLLLNTGGGFGFLAKASAGDVILRSNSDSGDTTSEDGGGQSVSSNSGGGQTASSTDAAEATASSSTLSQTTPSSSTQSQTTPSSSTQSQTTPTSSDNGDHTHTVTIPSHAHTVLPVINTVYGIFREEMEHTYTIEHLEYRVNSGAWLDLAADADLSDNGWYILDITDFVADIATKSFRPLQPGNLLEMRAITGTATVQAWDDQTTYVRFHTTGPHGFAVGESVEISGAALGNTGGSNVNGVWEVSFVEDADTFWSEGPQVIPALDFGTAGGTARIYRTATIDAQLSVGSIIQAFI